MVKTFLILFLVLAVLAVGGGSFYYFEIYQPQTYATLILSLYQKLENIGFQPNTPSLKNETDYEHALRVLEERINLLGSIQGELTQIYTPKRMINVKKEFANYLDLAQAQHTHARRLTSFVGHAYQLQNAIQEIHGDPALTQKNIVTMGDFQKFWSERVSNIKTLATQMFNEEITELTNPSFIELHLLWGNASSAFDLVLKKMKAANPNIPVSQVGNIFTPAEVKQLDQYSKHLEDFIKKLEALIKKYSAYDLLAFRYFPDVSQAESSERILTFYQIMQKLKEQYTQ